jgi:hypothetical protein
MDISKDKKLIKKFSKFCFIGQRLVVATRLVKDERNSKKVLHVSRALVETVYSTLSSSLTLSPPPTVQLPPLSKLLPGDKISGLLDLKASKYTKNLPALSISLGSYYPHARVCVCEIDDVGDWSDFAHTGIFEKNNEEDDNDADMEGGDMELSLHDGRQAGEVVKGVVMAVLKDRVEISLRPSRLVR